MHFSDPLYLLLLIPLAAILIFSYPRVRGMMKVRKRVAFFLRALVASALIVALAGPQAYHLNRGLCTVFVLDRSDSIRDSDRTKQDQFVKDAAQHMGPDDEAGVVAFGKDAEVENSPEERLGFNRVLSVIDGSNTDVASAIRLASAIFPDGKSKRIVLLSDGNETSGDAEQAAQVAASEAVPVEYVPLGLKDTKGEVAVNGLRMPSEARAGQPFQMQVDIDSDVNTEGTVSVDRDGVEIKKLSVTLTPGRNTFSVDQTLDGVGFHRFRATLVARRDGDSRNNVGMGFVTVRGKPKILLLQARAGPSLLSRALAEQSIDTDVHGPEGIPTRADQIQNYDAVIFDDLNASLVSPSQMSLFKTAIRDTGVGFAMIGGENSFLPGGWYGTPVADALPVDLEVKKRQSFPSTSVLIICDTSGSMGMVEDGVQKVKLAAKAAAMTIQMLPSTTRAGVVASTDGIEFVAPMQELTDKSAMEAEAMRMSVGGGGIYAKPSMDFAIKVLSSEPTKVRHLILMADGSDVDLRDGCFEVALQMKAMHITTSCVAIGDGQYVPFLRELAAVGGGKFYLALHGNQLPAVFTQDAAIMSRSAIEEGAFLPKVALGEPILRGISSDTIPPLFAYDLTESKPLARIGMKTAKDDPLLATWQYGLGSSLAFTSDAQARWASKWVTWDGFGTFWAQAIREISRRSTSNHYQVEAHLEGSKAVVTVKARDENNTPINNLPAKVTVSRPDGTSSTLNLSQNAPGQYVGSFGATDVGSYIFSVSEAGSSGAAQVSSSGFSIPYPPEYKSFQANLPLLQSLAQASGGHELSDPAEAFAGMEKPGFSIQDLWPIFILIAAIVLPLDVASRRLALPVQEAWSKLVKWLRSSRRSEKVDVAHVQVLERLHTARKRVIVDATEPTDSFARITPTAASGSKAATGAEPTSASTKLLEAKRKRKEES